MVEEEKYNESDWAIRILTITKIRELVAERVKNFRTREEEEKNEK